jgi:hypothetical protein
LGLGFCAILQLIFNMTKRLSVFFICQTICHSSSLILDNCYCFY